MSRFLPALVLALAVPATASAQDAGAGAGADAGTDEDAGTAPGTDEDAGTAPGTDEDAGTAPGTDEDAGTAAATAAPAEPGADLLPRDLWPTMDVSVEPTEGLMVGDLVTLTITADANEGDDLAVPRQDFAPFEVHSTDVRQEERAGGPRFVFTVKLLALEPGEHTVGPLRLRVVTADGTIGRVETEPVTISVGSLLGNEPNAQPKPATEPVRVMEEDYTLAWIGGALAAIVILALLMLWIARWWARREKPLPPPPPPRPAWDVALEKLEALRRSLPQAVAGGTVEKWADELSDTVREYLGGRFDFEGLESTTDEVVARLRKIQAKGLSVEEVQSLLGDCDLVKFAKATAGEEQCERMLEASYRVVRRTMQSFAARASASPAGQSTPAAPPPGGAA